MREVGRGLNSVIIETFGVAAISKTSQSGKGLMTWLRCPFAYYLGSRVKSEFPINKRDSFMAGLLGWKT